MTDPALNLDRHVQALTQAHSRTKELCRQIGIDVEAAETFAREWALTLPWDDLAAPQQRLAATRQILKYPPASGDTAQDIIGHFCDSIHNDHPIGLIGAMALVDNHHWSSAGKVAFLAFFPLSHYNSFVFPVSLSTMRPDSAALQGVLSWMAHDIIEATSLGSSDISDNFSKARDVLSKGLSSWLAEIVSQEATHDDDTFRKQLEDSLISLGSSHPDSGRLVSDMLQVINAECADASGRTPAEIRLFHELLRLYPPPLEVPDLSGEAISREALERFSDLRAALAFTELARQPLTNQPEWDNPLGEALNEIRARELVLLEFQKCDLVTSPKARDVLLELVTQCPEAKFVFSSKLFFKRNSDDSSFEDLSEDLNLFVKTGLRSSVTGKTFQPDFEARREDVLSLLESVVTLVGRDRVTILSPEAAFSYKADGATPTCLFTDGDSKRIGPGESRVLLYLSRPEPKDDSIRRLKRALEIDAPETVVADIVHSAISDVAVPRTSERDESKDHHGLNGYRANKVGLRLAGARVDEIGTLPLFEPVHFRRAQDCLTIVYTGRHEETSPEAPIDSEETPLEESSYELASARRRK